MISPDSKDLRNGLRRISWACQLSLSLSRGRNTAKKGAKAVGQFGKALANIAKKAALTWGAKALEFLSRNLWIVALFLTYLLYDSLKAPLKDRYKQR